MKKLAIVLALVLLIAGGFVIYRLTDSPERVVGDTIECYEDVLKALEGVENKRDAESAAVTIKRAYERMEEVLARRDGMKDVIEKMSAREKGELNKRYNKRVGELRSYIMKEKSRLKRDGLFGPIEKATNKKGRGPSAMSYSTRR